MGSLQGSVNSVGQALIQQSLTKGLNAAYSRDMLDRAGYTEEKAANTTLGKAKQEKEIKDIEKLRAEKEQKVGAKIDDEDLKAADSFKIRKLAIDAFYSKSSPVYAPEDVERATDIVNSGKFSSKTLNDLNEYDPEMGTLVETVFNQSYDKMQADTQMQNHMDEYNKYVNAMKNKDRSAAVKKAQLTRAKSRKSIEPIERGMNFD